MDIAVETKPKLQDKNKDNIVFVNSVSQQNFESIKAVYQGTGLSEDYLRRTKAMNQKARDAGLGNQVIKETFNQANKAGIDATYTMQVLLITGFSLDDIRKYGEPVAKDADFSLRNIMETRSSAQYMVEQQILGMVLTRKFEESGFKRDLLSPIAGFA